MRGGVEPPNNGVWRQREGLDVVLPSDKGEGDVLCTAMPILRGSSALCSPTCDARTCRRLSENAPQAPVQECIEVYAKLPMCWLQVLYMCRQHICVITVHCFSAVPPLCLPKCSCQPSGVKIACRWRRVPLKVEDFVSTSPGPPAAVNCKPPAVDCDEHPTPDANCQPPEIDGQGTTS